MPVKIIVFILILSIIFLNGCGTYISIMDGDFGPYSGIKRTTKELRINIKLNDRDKDLIIFLLLLDWPYSFVFDTILLPISIWR